MGFGPNRPLWADGLYVTLERVGGRLLGASLVPSQVAMDLATFAKGLIVPTGILPSRGPGRRGASGIAR